MFINQRFFYDAETPNGNSGGVEDLTLVKEKIDKQNEFRATQGLEALPYPEGIEPTAAVKPTLSQIEQFREDKVKELTANNAGMSQEDINMEAEKLVLARAAEIEAEQEVEKERLRLEQVALNAPPVVKIKSKAPIKVEKIEEEKIEDEPDIDEVLLLKQLSKKAGKEITSLDEFLNPTSEPTEADKEKLAQERENAKVAFALQNKIISKTEIESFIADTKDLEGVAYSFYHTQQLSLDDTLTEKQIRDAFEERFGLDAPEESKEYKAGQQEINFIANSIISKKHAKYLNLEGAFSEYENEQNQRTQYQQKVLQLAPSYKKDVDAVIGSISKIKIGEHEVVLDEELLDGYKSQMLDTKYSEPLIGRGWTLDSLQAATRNHVIIENLEAIVTGILDAEKLKYQAGQRGVIPTKNVLAKVLDEKENSERVALQERLGMQTN